MRPNRTAASASMVIRSRWYQNDFFAALGFGVVDFDLKHWKALFQLSCLVFGALFRFELAFSAPVYDQCVARLRQPGRNFARGCCLWRGRDWRRSLPALLAHGNGSVVG